MHVVPARSWHGRQRGHDGRHRGAELPARRVGGVRPRGACVRVHQRVHALRCAPRPAPAAAALRECGQSPVGAAS